VPEAAATVEAAASTDASLALGLLSADAAVPLAAVLLPAPLVLLTAEVPPATAKAEESSLA